MHVPLLDAPLAGLALLAALGCGLIGGVFFAFSNFVMQALARRPAAEGIAAMQAINVTVLNVWFLGIFLGTAAVSGVAVIASLLRWHEPEAGWLLIGGTLYIVGNLIVTRRFNIPLNEALRKIDPASAEGASLWADYLVKWSAWNHVRTATAFAAAVCFGIALRVN